MDLSVFHFLINCDQAHGAQTVRPRRGATAAGGNAIERRAQTKGENRTGDSTKPGEVRGEEIFGAGLTEGVFWWVDLLY